MRGPLDRTPKLMVRDTTTEPQMQRSDLKRQLEAGVYRWKDVLWRKTSVGTGEKQNMECRLGSRLLRLGWTFYIDVGYGTWGR